MAQIKVESVAKTFGTFAAVKGVNFTVDHGSFLVILGPSGCGKTTTLRMIAGLELPTSGRILLDGEDVTALPASARDIAFVFQLFALYPHMNVRQNIGFPLRCQNYPRAEIRRSVEETAKLLRIDHLLERRVGGLSGGDRQRVALGRAIVRRPKAFLMDEPLGALELGISQVDVRRAARAARPHRCDHRLHHPRPARGDGDGGPYRHHEPGPGRADRHAAGDLRSAQLRCSWPTLSARRR